eukprot:16435416-Heterocapsa_arctica.AAC.1
MSPRPPMWLYSVPKGRYAPMKPSRGRCRRRGRELGKGCSTLITWCFRKQNVPSSPPLLYVIM